VAVTEPIGEHDLEKEAAVPLRLDLTEYDSNVTLSLDALSDLNEITGTHRGRPFPRRAARVI